MADEQSPTMTTETVYTCKDRDGNYRYVGRTKLPLQKRAALHAEQLRTDYLASPLYRFMHDHDAHFAPDDWAIVSYYTHPRDPVRP